MTGLSGLIYRWWKNVALGASDIYDEESDIMDSYLQWFVTGDFVFVLKLSIVGEILASDLSSSSSVISLGGFYFFFRWVYSIEFISFKFT